MKIFWIEKLLSLSLKVDMYIPRKLCCCCCFFFGVGYTVFMLSLRTFKSFVSLISYRAIADFIIKPCEHINFHKTKAFMKQ